MHKLTESDYPKGGHVLARAFKDDPIWANHLKDPARRGEILPLMFEFLLRMGDRFGKVWTTGKEMDGIAVTFTRKYTDIGFFRLLFSGLIFKSGKMLQKYAKDMTGVQKEMKVLSRERRQIMEGREYIYLNCIGVDPQSQGKGLGSSLLKRIFESSENQKVPLYLETETEENMKMYSRYGFKLVNEKEFAGSGLRIWQMVREPLVLD